MIGDCNWNDGCDGNGSDYQACIRASCSVGNVSRGTDPAITLPNYGHPIEYVIRTPDLPGEDFHCANCGADSFAHTIAFRVPINQGQYRVTVGAPWSIYLMDVEDPLGNGTLKDCPADMKQAAEHLYQSPIPALISGFSLPPKIPTCPRAMSTYISDS